MMIKLKFCSVYCTKHIDLLPTIIFSFPAAETMILSVLHFLPKNDILSVKEGDFLKTWNEYKQYVKRVDPESAKAMTEAEKLAESITESLQQQSAGESKEKTLEE